MTLQDRQRKIAVVTGSRAEYGLLYPIIKKIHQDPKLELQLIVTGTHLSKKFGFTINQIKKDGFPIAQQIPILAKIDDEQAITTAISIAVTGLAKVYQQLKPDLLLILGDRFEILVAIIAAAPFRIPVAHIHGGETTQGSLDELFRHAITKMSHLHFPACQKYAKRIIQMGEQPKRVFCFGTPGLDNIKKIKLLDRTPLRQKLSLPIQKKYGIITYHPETISTKQSKNYLQTIIKTINLYPDIYWVFTLPNADCGHQAIIKIIKKYVKQNPSRAVLFNSLGQKLYLSLMAQAAIMIGNSSSGIIEAPSFKLPVINIGERQKGRIKAKNVIDLPICTKDALKQTIKQALSQNFKNSLKNTTNPYEGRSPSINIFKTLKTINLKNIYQKTFYDLP